MIQPFGADGQDVGRPLVAVDSVGAGVGERVFFVRGKEASFPFHPTEVPADAGIVGIIDHWSTDRGPGLQPGRSAMILARVVGEVVSTQKRPQFEGAKLLILQPETPAGAKSGTSLLAIDSVGAGRGELVIAVLEGRAAGEALGRKLVARRCGHRRHRRCRRSRRSR